MRTFAATFVCRLRLLTRLQDHDLQHLHDHGVDFIVSGSGARNANKVSTTKRTKFATVKHGFVGLQVADCSCI